MSVIDIPKQNCAKEGGSKFIFYYKRFIDDIFVIWTGSQEQFKVFMIRIKKLNPAIKFTNGYDKKD
jgi:hypothetical protein